MGRDDVEAELSRREVLRLGGAFGLGLTLPDYLRAQTARSTSARGRADRVRA